MPHTIVVSAVTVLDPEGRILLVRKQGTARFMQPGGKHEPGETPAQAASREIHEELGIRLAPDSLTAHGIWRGATANEPGHELVAHLFEARLTWDNIGAPGTTGTGSPHSRLQPQAEIAEALWLAPEAALNRTDLAPLLREHVLPALVATS